MEECRSLIHERRLTEARHRLAPLANNNQWSGLLLCYVDELEGVDYLVLRERYGKYKYLAAQPSSGLLNDFFEREIVADPTNAAALNILGCFVGKDYFERAVALGHRQATINVATSVRYWSPARAEALLQHLVDTFACPIAAYHLGLLYEQSGSELTNDWRARKQQCFELVASHPKGEPSACDYLALECELKHDTIGARTWRLQGALKNGVSCMRSLYVCFSNESKLSYCYWLGMAIKNDTEHPWLSQLYDEQLAAYMARTDQTRPGNYILGHLLSQSPHYLETVARKKPGKFIRHLIAFSVSQTTRTRHSTREWLLVAKSQMLCGGQRLSKDVTLIMARMVWGQRLYARARRK